MSSRASGQREGKEISTSSSRLSRSTLPLWSDLTLPGCATVRPAARVEITRNFVAFSITLGHNWANDKRTGHH